jgi:hypothetical protein
MNIGFTGTQRGMSDKQQIAFECIVSGNIFIQELHHGDCIGADTDAHNIFEMVDAVTVIHPPIKSKKRAFSKCSAILAPKPYLERNHDIVNATDLLIAAPETIEEVLRSGTWATIRYARKRNKPVIILAP